MSVVMKLETKSLRIFTAVVQKSAAYVQHWLDTR
jgi:hypothetical protein